MCIYIYTYIHTYTYNSNHVFTWPGSSGPAAELFKRMRILVEIVEIVIIEIVEIV